MEKLSRTLQSERNTLKEQLKQFVTEKSVSIEEVAPEVTKEQTEETTNASVEQEKSTEEAQKEAESKVENPSHTEEATSNN